MGKDVSQPVKLKVVEALSKDMGRAYARMDPDDMVKLGANVGDIVEIVGKRRTVCKAMPAYKDLRGQARVQLDGISRHNARAGLDETVTVQKVSAKPADRVVLSPVNVKPSERDLEYIGSLLDGLPVVEG
ncbi:MAG: AAA family ATPase, partial [Desulfomonilaceae bacterium]